MKPILFIICVAFLFACTNAPKQTEIPEEKYATSGSIERIDPLINDLINADAKIEVLASGFLWSEGPLYIEELGGVVFTDVPMNTVYLWTEQDSISVYLQPSGYTGEKQGKEGANGLILNREGQLVLCQHGDRRLAYMNAPLNEPTSTFTTLTDQIDGKRYNSPNDVVMNSNEQYFFTDPPYGLQADDTQELEYFGVFRLDTNGTVKLLIDSLSRPNGVALSPDESILYVAVSDPDKARYYAYQLNENKDVVEGKMILDVTHLVAERKGLPDGLKVDNKGNIFATGPGGVLIISPEGKHLGTILTGFATANCAFNSDKSILYMTAHQHLMRIKL